MTLRALIVEANGTPANTDRDIDPARLSALSSTPLTWTPNRTEAAR
jgi:hypothetical protein